MGFPIVIVVCDTLPTYGVMTAMSDENDRTSPASVSASASPPPVTVTETSPTDDGTTRGEFIQFNPFSSV